MSQQERIPAIIGIGAAHGDNIVTNRDIAPTLFPDKNPEIAEKLMDRLMRPVGIRSRYWVSHEQTDIPVAETAIKDNGFKLTGLEKATSDMASEALLQALDMAHVEPNALKTIVVGSGSQDYRGVAVAALVQEKLGIPKDVRTYDVYSACPGWVQALYNSFSDLESRIGGPGPQAVIGAETLSPILSKKERLLYPLFGDAAGAVVVDMVEPDTGAPTNMGFAFGTDGRYATQLYMPGGGSKHPTSEMTLMNDLHTLKMDGGLIADLAVQNMASLTKKVLEQTGVPIEEVTLLIPHQANLEIMKNTADALGIPQDKMMVTIDHYGNTSAASIPTALREAWETGRIKRNDILAFATFGAGLNYGAGIIPMVGLPKNL